MCHINRTFLLMFKPDFVGKILVAAAMQVGYSFFNEIGRH